MENIVNKLILVDGDMSADLTSDILDTSKIDGMQVVAVIKSGNAVGEISLETSIEVNPEDADFDTLPDSTFQVNGTGRFVWTLRAGFVVFDKIRVSYSRNSGIGFVDVRINGKGDFR